MYISPVVYSVFEGAFNIVVNTLLHNISMHAYLFYDICSTEFRKYINEKRECNIKAEVNETFTSST